MTEVTEKHRSLCKRLDRLIDESWSTLDRQRGFDIMGEINEVRRQINVLAPMVNALEERMAVNVNITNELARVVGLIGQKHLDRSIQIEWREGSPHEEWFVTASDGTNDTVYVVHDESGTWMPLNETDLARYERGETVIGDLEDAVATREP